MNLKAFFGLQSKTEKLKEFRLLLSERYKLEKDVESLAEAFALQKSQYDSLSKEPGEVGEKAKSCFHEFSMQQAKDVSGLFERKSVIEKGMNRLKKDEDLLDSFADIEYLAQMRDYWRQGRIAKSVYFDLMKAKFGKVGYADVLVFHKGKMLILSRCEEGHGTDTWCIPGGHVDPGESSIEAAVRELFEETGIQAKESELMPVASYSDKKADIHYYMYNCDHNEEVIPVIVDSEEASGHAWIELSELDNYKFIFDMKDNVKKILGIQIEDTPFQVIAKSFANGDVSAKFFEEYVASHPDEIEKAANKTDFSHKERKDLAKEGEAMPNGKYPIRNKQDLHDAIKLVGSSSMPESEVKAWIKKRAKELNLTDELPKDWIEKTMDTADAQILSRESLDTNVENVTTSQNGKPEIEKAITFTKKVYKETVEEVVPDEPSKYSYGQFMINYSDNDGGHAEKLGDFLATLEKVTRLGKPFSITLKTEENGEQEWKWKGTMRLNGVVKTENLSKSCEDELEKADFTEDERKELSKKGEAMPDGKFPIRNASDLHNAIKLAGHSDLPESKVKAWIRKRAKELNLENELPESWDKVEKSARTEKEIFNTYLNFLEGAKTRLKNIHWGEEDNSKHVYLDSLSEKVAEFEDKIAEAGQSGFGRFKDDEIQSKEVTEDDPVKICQMIFEGTIEFRKELHGKDDYNGEISWIDDFLATLKQSKYRLQMH